MLSSSVSGFEKPEVYCITAFRETPRFHRGAGIRESPLAR